MDPRDPIDKAIRPFVAASAASSSHALISFVNGFYSTPGFWNSIDIQSDDDIEDYRVANFQLTPWLFATQLYGAVRDTRNDSLDLPDLSFSIYSASASAHWRDRIAHFQMDKMYQRSRHSTGPRLRIIGT